MRRNPVGALTVLLVASLACSFPGLPNLAPGGSAETQTASTTGGESATPVPTPSVRDIETLEAPPPSGVLEAVVVGVDRGDWTYGEGLVRALQLFAGEASMAEVFSEAPDSVEGFALVREAQRYLENGDDPAAQTEIERLLTILTPTGDQLLEYADPVAGYPGRSAGLADARAAAENCEDLFAEGFPAGSGIKCLLYKEGGLLGQTVRVFWPLTGLPTEYADAAYTAVTQSLQRYSQLTPGTQPAFLKGVDVLFTLLPHVESATVLASVPSSSTDNRCMILVYLKAIQDNEEKQGNDDDYGHFLQVIAHETFHCYQVWNFPDQADDDWSIQDWWGEGTAEYFSNVVYPEINEEWRWKNAMSYLSLTNSIVDMSYENFAFFQFVANKMGNDAMLALIGKLPFGGGAAEQAAAVAQWPAMQTVLHDFDRAYMDGSILDTSGSSIPTSPPYIPSDHRIQVDVTQIRILEADPFELGRYAIRFPQGFRYSVSQVIQGSAEGYLSARIDTGQTWGDLPETISTPCAPLIYYVALTTAQAGGGAFAVELTMTPEDEVVCDECLIGTWDVNAQSYEEYSVAPFAEIPGFYSFDGADGTFRYTFEKDGSMGGEFDWTHLYHLNQETGTGSELRVDGEIRLEGFGTGTYTTDGVGHLTTFLGTDGVTMSQKVWINGELASPSGTGFGPTPFNYGAGSFSMVYSCDEDTLFLNFMPNSDVFPPLQFDRKKP